MIKKSISLIDINKSVPLLFILICIGAFIELLSFSSLIPVAYFFVSKSDNQILLYIEHLVKILFLNYNFEIEIKLIIIISILTIFFIKFLYILFLTFFQSNYTADLEIKLKKFFLINYIKYGNKKIKNADIAIFLRNIQNEVSIFIKSVFYPGLTIILELLILCFSIVALLIYNFRSTLVLLIIFAALSSIYFITFKKRFHYWGKIRQFHVARQFSTIIESLNLSKLINIYDIKYFFIKKFNYHLNEHKKITIKNSLFLIFPRIFLEFFFIFLISLISIFYLLSGNQLDDLFTLLVVYIVIASRLFPAITRIAASFQSISSGKASVNVLFNEKKIFENLSDNNKIKKISFNKNIKFENLNISIFDEKKKINKIILDNASFKISKNEFIGLVGRSGVGKTTLINYLLGFASSEKSNVFVDGNKLKNSACLNFSKIGLVAQEPLIFNGIIKENLYFQENVTIDKIRLDKVIEITNLKEFIKQSKLGLETLISEKGKNISGGQIQQICIARALIFEPKILILDEATSALDLKTENKILSSLKKIKDLTCIIISHRKETLISCDKIYQIDNKKIILKR